MPKENKLFESFNWVVPFEVGNRKGKKVIIRGQALFPLVSKNLRRYIEEELVRSARTLANGYIDVNHEYSLWAATQEGYKPHLKGNVIDAEFEDGAIEYVGQVNHPEYFEKLIDGERLSEQDYFDKWGKKPIKHVSVDAIYRFHNAGEDWQGIEPRGIRFNGLSMVEDPEVPGVAGTTLEVIEIRETIDNPQFKLLQNYFKDIGVATEILEKEGKLILDLKEDNIMKIEGYRTNPDVIKRMLEQEEEERKCPEGQRWDEESQSCVPIATEQQECPEGQKWDEEQQKCVPIVTEQEGHECPEGERWDPEQGKCVPVATEQEECPDGQRWDTEKGECVPIEEEITEQEDERKCPEGEVWDDDKGECVPKEEIAKEFYKLGEPFADYTDFDDCVSKNQDKEDPEAYCASIKQQVEGETYSLETKHERELRELRDKQRWEKFSTQFNNFRKRLKTLETLKKKVSRIERNITKLTKEQEKTLKESKKSDMTLQRGIKSIQDNVSKLTAEQKKTIKETQNTAHVEVHALQESMQQVTDKIESLMVGEDERKEIRQMFNEYQVQAKEKLDGIIETLKKIPKLEEDFESLKTHIKPDFQVEASAGLTETAQTSKPITDPVKG